MLKSKLIKILLGSAAGMIAVRGAQAADSPAKLRLVEYVKVCSVYGAGFYYIPGSDTCMKLGGYIRADVLSNTNSDDNGNYTGAGAAKNRFTNAYIMRARLDQTLDTRTATEYGVVRTFAELGLTWTTDTYAGNGGGGTVYANNGQNNASTGLVDGGQIGVWYAFIQFAGFTMGKAQSQFSAPWANFPGNNFNGLVGGGGTVTGVNQFAYTADFGQGITATISAQDQTQYYQPGTLNANIVSVTSPFGTNNYAGTVAPDLVATVKVDQAWGMIQGSIAAHDNHAAYYGGAPVGGAAIPDSGTELAGHPDDKWGWAAALALSIKNLPTGKGDTLNVQGIYTNGATRYNIQDQSQAANMVLYGSGGDGYYQSLGYGIAPDSVFGIAPDGTRIGLQLISTWGFRGAYIHNWNPYWRTSLYGAYGAVSYNSTAKALLCGVNGVGGTFRTNATIGFRGTTCNPDYNIGQIGLNTRWTPVKNLSFVADLTYTMLDQKMVGSISGGSVAIGKPSGSGLYQLKDTNSVILLLRAQKNF